MRILVNKGFILIAGLLLLSAGAFAQGDAKASARIDAKQIMIGDQARLFIEIQNNPANGRLSWAAIPDSFNNLEVVEKGKIDTEKQGDIEVYKQRLLITGFDSGTFRIPAFVFAVIPNSGTTYTVQTDSFDLLVQTVAVDTAKGFKGIKGIMTIKGSWLDYVWYAVGGIVFIVLLIFVILYFLKNKKAPAPKPQGPVETLQEYALRLLAELDTKQLWQKKQVKEYYVQLTDIVRNYIEQRYETQVMELTTDELLGKVHTHKELLQHYDELSTILHTADLAKFAKAEPTPQEHMEAMDMAKQFVNTSRPVIIVQNTADNNAKPQTDNTTV